MLVNSMRTAFHEHMCAACICHLFQQRINAHLVGVVCVASSTRTPIRFSTVLSKPQVYPNDVKSLYNNVAIVVLPLVPVTPTSFSFSEGCP